ncbi:MAG: nuclear transport factor 2 family protein [Gammaproteobacteria bacterium]|nr:nuclear transport factor 2 family protein [Gammaproteobacteria bacterium]
MARTLTTADRLAIHELIGLYGHLIDQRAFARLHEIFTPDAVFDLTGYGGDIYHGLEAIIELMEQSHEHPLAHHATNIVVEKVIGETARVISKGLGVGHQGRVGSVVYRDELLNNNGVWRIRSRAVSLRSREDTQS